LHVSIGALILAALNLLAGGAIEGRVSLPLKAKPAVSPARYESRPGAVARTSAPPAAVVYVEANFLPKHATNRTVTAKMIQREFQFLPAVLPIQTGSAVEFPNEDNDYHNVFSYSKPRRFDLGRYRKDEKPAAVVFDKPGVVKLYCEIHEHMRATILVLDTPHFVRTDADGSYRLTDLPPGQYKLKAWLDENRVFERAVAVREGETEREDFGGSGGGG
jgi:plastocyanin